jgi:hypothetical protein
MDSIVKGMQVIQAKKMIQSVYDETCEPDATDLETRAIDLETRAIDLVAH